jgi:hypothetical protein
MPSAVAAVAALLLLPGTAAAHGRSVSYSRWTIDAAGAAVELRLARAELASAGVPSGPALATYAAERLRLTRGGRACDAGGVRVRDAAPGWVTLGWTVWCDASGPLALESRLLVEAHPQHLHFARVADGGRASEHLVQAADGPLVLGGAGAARAAGASLLEYVALGVEHIATGWDHLAFVVALVLLAATVREVVGLATGFTVAHSVTLALAVTGIVRPDPGSVEALIGFSIALVAAENAWLLAGRPRAVPLVAAGSLAAMALLVPLGLGRVDGLVLAGIALFSWCHFGLLGRAARPAPLRVIVAFAFGLVHGFGFAGVLHELALPPRGLALALGGFNAGVELGQLAVIGLVWPLARLAGSLGAARAVTELGSAALCGLGVFWLVVRAFAR